MNSPPPATVLQAVIESPENIVIFALDRQYRYLVFNGNHARTMKAIWNVDIEVGESMLEYIGRADDRDRARANFDRCLAGEAFALDEEYGDETRRRRYYQNLYSPIRVGQQVVGLTLFLADVTDERRALAELEVYRTRLERKVAERTRELAAAHAQILHAQKVESLGVMAGGIAHDFNNTLVGVLGCADLALEQMPSDAVGRDLLEQIRAAARHAAALTDRMLAYAGKSPRKIDSVDVSATIRSVEGILRASVPKNVALTFDLSSGVPPIFADATQLQQVLVNLVTNAAEAIGDAPGHVTVSTEVRELEREALAETYLDDDLPSGEYLVLRVHDDGCGIDEATHARLFDPFFTTKFAGRGLGLASVIGIVRGHRGAVRVESAPGHGATFEVLLPREGPGASPAESGSTRDVVPERRGPRIALVIDDEPIVREITARMLQQIGFTVVAVEDGFEGLRVFEERGSQLSIVLLDMTMPRLSGEATLRRIREISADVPVVVVSGYPADHDKVAFVGSYANVGFLHKPFDLAELDRAVAGVIEGDG